MGRGRIFTIKPFWKYDRLKMITGITINAKATGEINEMAYI